MEELRASWRIVCNFQGFLKAVFMNLPRKFIGRPPNWVSHEQTVHRTVCSPVLIFGRQKMFRRLRTTTKGAAFGIRKFSRRKLD